MIVHDLTYLQPNVEGGCTLVTVWSYSKRKLEAYWQSMETYFVKPERPHFQCRNWHPEYLSRYKEII